ncbi:MAG: flavodoxin domain-containing protein [Candidatus Pseudobacter hemicellulosilyticus]|uniref:assimilatory sulfite reductase (NADPH) n=1 Tax=Candidatus Pseudobacter hemicellulosilyticus TaxID=3121375 RepID=A0AAJ5WT49_9BACT|nr:MAG: flavodoxin domain-containing protein [Pseudobacter sp.]
MLVEPKLKTLLDLVQSSNREELIWINGYLAGLLAQPAGSAPATAALPPPAAATAAPAVQKITITYGTETGNSKKLATDFAAQVKKAGIMAKLVSLDQYRLNDLAKEEYFFTIISTQGDGEPPATAKKFYDHVQQSSLKLGQLKYGVLALGDTSYPLFCKAGEEVDGQLTLRGGQRVVPLRKCDTDYEKEALSWFTEVLELLSGQHTSPAATVVTNAVVPKKNTGRKVYAGAVLGNVNLNDRGSSKETYHIEIGAEEDIDYLPGDALGVIPENPQSTAEAIIALTGINPTRTLSFRNEQYTVFDLLKKKLNIVHLPERVVKQYAQLVQQDIPETKIGLLNLLKIYPVRDAAQFEEVISLLEPITPRLYSIASSPAAHSGEVHLTVALDHFSVNGEKHFGLCSRFLSELQPDATLEFYIHRNQQFRLPAPGKDLIMIGPGTGIAPFRSFLAERDAAGAAGRNWLFFGEQHFVSDFLYQTELQNWLQTGVLTRLNLAFSRDQQYKIYVQHRMLEQAAELWQWIESGAHIYVCGAKEPMSRDVEYTLLQIIERFGAKDTQDAISYLDKLKEEGRYLKDVY